MTYVSWRTTKASPEDVAAFYRRKVGAKQVSKDASTPATAALLVNGVLADGREVVVYVWKKAGRDTVIEITVHKPRGVVS